MRIKSMNKAGVLLLAGALAMSACADSDRDEGSGEGGETRDVIVFAASSDPTRLDPAFASDGETFRVARQIYEGLIDLEDGGTEVVPALASSWETEDSQKWTFHLEEGVTFHDGTPFNAEAVCFNFERWYNWNSPLLQSSSVTYYWQSVFGGFKTKVNPDAPDTSLYQSCEATDETTVTINLTAPSSAFLPALSLPPFAMQSPTALQEFDADAVSGTGDDPSFDGTYWREHPTGTGPYKFSSWDAGSQVELVRNDDYWGEPAKTERLVFATISDNNDRRQQLLNGEIDGYDNVDAADFSELRDNDMQIAERAPFSIGYIGMNLAKPPLDNPKIRQAIAHAINREALVTAKYPEGAEVASQFLPKELLGYNDEGVPQYEYDVDLAKQLIAESGVANPTIEFAYPTDVSRPYMPNPADNWSLIKADLEAAGFTVNERTQIWEQYLQEYQAGAYQMYLIGWNADYADPDNFLGVFFRDISTQFGGYDNPELRQLLADARASADNDERSDLYHQASTIVQTDLPMLPYVLVGSYIALAPGVEGFVANPVVSEDFSTVTVS